MHREWSVTYCTTEMFPSLWPGWDFMKGTEGTGRRVVVMTFSNNLLKYFKNEFKLYFQMTLQKELF